MLYSRKVVNTNQRSPVDELTYNLKYMICIGCPIADSHIETKKRKENCQSFLTKHFHSTSLHFCKQQTKHNTSAVLYYLPSTIYQPYIGCCQLTASCSLPMYWLFSTVYHLLTTNYILAVSCLLLTAHL